MRMARKTLGTAPRASDEVPSSRTICTGERGVKSSKEGWLEQVTYAVESVE